MRGVGAREEQRRNGGVLPSYFGEPPQDGPLLGGSAPKTTQKTASDPQEDKCSRKIWPLQAAPAGLAGMETKTPCCSQNTKKS